MTTQNNIEHNQEFPTYEEIQRKIQNVFFKVTKDGVNVPIEDYPNLSYTLSSVLKLCQKALLAQIEFPEYTNHNLKSLYNLISLAQSLVPEEEMELLDFLHQK